MSSPKFKLTILGIAPGHDPQTVRLALANSLNASEQEVDALLQNQAPICQLGMDHEDAWMVKSDLLELGVDCHIKPVPLHGLGERAGSMTLQGAEIDRLSAPKPTVIRRADQATRMRSGQGRHKALPPQTQKVGAVKMVAMVGAIALCVWFLQTKLTTQPTVPTNVASMTEAAE